MKNLRYFTICLVVLLTAACEKIDVPVDTLVIKSSNAVGATNSATLTLVLEPSISTVQTIKVHYALAMDMANAEQVIMQQKDNLTYTVTLTKLKSAQTYYVQYEMINNFSSRKHPNIYHFTTKKEKEPASPQYVDMGFPSGVKWATFNIGATKPEECGDYFAWGETETKNTYTWDVYKWCQGTYNSLTKYNTDSEYGVVDNKTILDPEDDAAVVKWGGEWRTPSIDEWNELISSCTLRWESKGGMQGLSFVSNYNGNSIFIPAAGFYHYDNGLVNHNLEGQYRTNALDASRGTISPGLTSSNINWYASDRCFGLPVRPVCGAQTNPEIPTSMYIIGDFSGWTFVKMTPVHSHEGMFWCTLYMEQDAQFKFSPGEGWIGKDFGTEDGNIVDHNGQVTDAGLYTFVVDMVNRKVSVTAAKIYGIGEAFGSWEEDRYPFTINSDGTVSITTNSVGELRMYTDIANVDWWQAEYMIYDGKIVYRGSDGDQERVSVDAGMTITLNFNAGTGEIASPVSATPQYVDLGLPSGIKWADRNVGASKPWEFGDYFAWGETEPKERYHQETYKYCSYYDYYGYGYHLTKYCTNGNNGTTVDNKTILEAADDAAYIHWGGEWRMPTKEERDELYENCSWEWTTQNGVEGYKLTSKKNGNSIFLPLAGCIDDTWTNSGYGFYWTSSLNIEDNWNAYDINFTRYQYLLHDDVRYYGRSIRPVYGPRPATIPAVTTYAATQITDVSAVVGGNVTSDGGASVTERGVVYSTNPEPTISNLNNFIRPCGSGTGEFTYTITNLQANTTYYLRAYARNDKGTAYGEEISFTTKTSSSGGSATYEYVDLGLSVKWATFNVGASKPEEYGDYFAWGETEPKEEYSWSTYRWCDGSASTLTKYNTESNYGTVDNKTILESADDAASINWGGAWRMPTYSELTELRDSCTWTWTTLNDVYGCEVTSNRSGYTNKSIFLPAAGYRSGSSIVHADSQGEYASSTINSSLPPDSYVLVFHSGAVDCHYYFRYYGQSVRPVCP